MFFSLKCSRVRFILFSFILAVSAISLSAQDSAFYFQATVLNSLNGSPVSTCKISLHGSLRTCLADSAGHVQIVINKKRTLLTISAPFYKTKFVSVPYLIHPDNKLFLEPISRITEFFPPTVDNSFHQFKKNETIIGCEFKNEFAILLLRNSTDFSLSLRVLNSTGTEIQNIPVQGNSSGLFKNYKEEIFLLNESAARKLNIINGKIVQIEKPLEIKKFEKDQKGYVGEDAKSTYFRVTSLPEYSLLPDLSLKMQSKVITYFSIDKAKKYQALFKNIADDKNFINEYGEKNHFDLGFNRLPFCNGQVRYKELQIPAYFLKEKAYLFDFSNNKVEKYDSTGKIISSQALFFHLNAAWTKQLYFDAEKGEFYFIYQFDPDDKNNETSYALNNFDPETGKRKLLLKLENMNLQFLTCYNGYFYFFENNSLSILKRLKIPD